MTLREQLFEAGKLDGTYWNRAILDGRPYTTDALLKLHSNREITQSTIDSAADKAKEYLFADEIDAWRAYISLLVGRPPTTEEQAAYLLGLVYSIIDGDLWKRFPQGGQR